MQKFFNDTGTCVPSKHYMVDTGAKVSKIINMIEKGQYFTINKPRQFGKTTTIYQIINELKKNKCFFPILLSFEGIGDDIFESENKFCKSFFKILIKNLNNSGVLNKDLFTINELEINSIESLSSQISFLTQTIPQKLVLIIDEVDKSSNNQLFVSFLGMLRSKFLSAQNDMDFTFYSVVLAGVHDVKTLKMKINPENPGKQNSPWNIATDFLIDMTFKSNEIATMLMAYCEDRKVSMDIQIISEKIFFYTSGYPYLVSKICKIIDEILIPNKKVFTWNIEAVEESSKYLTNKNYSSTIFDDLIKNLENHKDLYDLIFEISINASSKSYTISNPVVNLGIVYGILKDNLGWCQIQNLIFEQRIYDYMLSKVETSNQYVVLDHSSFYTETGLNMKQILRKFQQFIKENYATKDIQFLEREGRLLFLSFIKPIINGVGHDFKESVIGNERRMDIQISYLTEKYILELKRWNGEIYHQKGLVQLSDYLELNTMKEGFLLIFDFRKEKEYKEETIVHNQKEIFTIWV